MNGYYQITITFSSDEVDSDVQALVLNVCSHLACTFADQDSWRCFIVGGVVVHFAQYHQANGYLDVIHQLVEPFKLVVKFEFVNDEE
jgi:hypothetical protein